MLNDFLGELALSLTQAAKKPNVLAYKTNSPVHELFHRSEKVGRILKGGNRSGKSVAGVTECVWRATGRHPYHKTHGLPVQGRIVTVDKDNGINDIILPLLKQWTPVSELVNGSFDDSYSKQYKTMTFRNGSTIDLKTHQQEVEAFAGVPRHFIWFDEECPQAIFNECRLRLVDFNGVWFMTMTPVEGQDWIFDRFISTANKNVEMFEVDISDNPHLNKEALVLLDEDLSDEEKEVRQKGIFVPKGGACLPRFDLNKHVIEGGRPIPKSWTVYVSIDHGFNNPTAILWHAVSPDGKVVTFAEHYMRKWVIDRHIDRLREINRQWGVKPLMYIGDPSMSQTTGETGVSPLDIYRQKGIPLLQGKKDVEGGLDKMNEYFEYDMWALTKDCPNSIKEFRGWSFEIYQSPKITDRNNVRVKPNKKNDHCPDSAKYFFSFMPWIKPEIKNLTKNVSLTVTNPEDFPWQIDEQFFHNGDTPEPEYGFGEI